MRREHMPTIRVLDILEAIMHEDKGLSLTMISNKTNILKGTLHPILKTLVDRGYISYDKHSQLYALGIFCFLFSHAKNTNLLWFDNINKEMQNIAIKYNENCQMAILDGSNVLFINKAHCKKHSPHFINIGDRLPAIYSAAGKVLLTEYTDQEILDLYPEGFKGLTSYSVSSIDKLRKQLQSISNEGYSIERCEAHEEMISYGVPLKQRNKIVASISISIPYTQAKEDAAKNIIDALISSRDKIDIELNELQDINLYI